MAQKMLQNLIKRYLQALLRKFYVLLPVSNMDPLKSLSMTVEWYRSNTGEKSPYIRTVKKKISLD